MTWSLKIRGPSNGVLSWNGIWRHQTSKTLHHCEHVYQNSKISMIKILKADLGRYDEPLLYKTHILSLLGTDMPFDDNKPS